MHPLGKIKYNPYCIDHAVFNTLRKQRTSINRPHTLRDKPIALPFIGVTQAGFLSPLFANLEHYNCPG